MSHTHTHRQACCCCSTHFSISGAQCTKSWLQNLKAGFLMSSMKVMRRPQGCGLFTISLSSRTLEEHTWSGCSLCVCACVSHLVICSWMASVLASANR